MRLLGPTRILRLNEAAGVVFLFAALFLLLSLTSFSVEDPSWNTAAGSGSVHNLLGKYGAHVADYCLQSIGLAAYALPLLVLMLAWKWLRSADIEGPLAKLGGSAMLVGSVCSLLSLAGGWKPIAGAIPAGGLVGVVLAGALAERLNRLGAALTAATGLILAIYLVSTFSMATLARWLRGPLAYLGRLRDRLAAWQAARTERAIEQRARRKVRKQPPPEPVEMPAVDEAPWEEPVAEEAEESEIPIRPLEPDPPLPVAAVRKELPPEPAEPAPPRRAASEPAKKTPYRIPETALLNEPQARSPYDSEELQEIAAAIKTKLEEFAVRGSVTQINPGPVVTTFEYKPDAGVKINKITTLSEDLCLGLQAESILIERIPGKSTVGIQVPNTKREVISLRQILESEEFQGSGSPLSIALGKDINGRIKVAALDSMPHLLIAGSTGSGKSVMLNSLIMSILYKSTPEQVRMILVDPKRLEMGLYEGIPHLLTPVITDAKKATNALRNAVLEMERRLKLLAAQRVRNIDQYNRKVRQLMEQPRSLFEDEAAEPELLEPLPYILVLIDELADLMMLEKANVELSVARLAQMARAAGMHLVLATQRPSVDVITGIIKANFPSRISFRVATRVDSRTVLDGMGAEHLLGKGDMLYSPPGSSQKTRVHGAFVTENEINRVVDSWKRQAEPEYDKSFLLAPPDDAETAAEEEEPFDGDEDPLYQDAVRVVLEMGKASTSTLQRRLSLGYGRAARILDMMQRDGIIGPPNGSKPRDVLKRPDWLEEAEAAPR